MIYFSFIHSIIQSILIINLILTLDSSSPKLGVWFVSRPTVQAKNDPSFELNSPKRCRVSGVLELETGMDDSIDSHGFMIERMDSG